MNEEFLALMDAAFERGEFNDEASAKRWLNQRGFDEMGNALPSKGSPFMRGLQAGVGPIGFGGTAERISRAFGLPSDMWREMSMAPGGVEAERSVGGTAPRPLGLFESIGEPPAGSSRQFSSGAALGALGTEVGKAYAAGKAGAALGRTAAGARVGGMLAGAAPGAARLLARYNPWVLGGMTALGAVEDVGSLPEESTAGLLSQAARAQDFPNVARALEALSESGAGRALTGATLGILPESMILGLPAAARRVQRALGGVEAPAPRPTAVDVPEELPSFPEGFSARGELPEEPTPLNAKQLLDDILADLPEEAATPTLNIAGSRRRPAPDMFADALRGLGVSEAEFNRNLTGAAAEGLRAETRRGATRIMEPIQAERDAQQILLRRNQERQAATTTQQKAAVERMHERENERLAGTPLGEALKRLAPAAVVGAAGLGALNQMDEESAPGAALLAGAFLPGMGRSLLRRPGRVVNPSAAGFLDKAYSRLETGVLNAKQERMSGRDWANALKGSVPQSEVEWTGLGRFLDENAGNTLSRDDVADYLAQNRVELSEYTLRPESWEETGEPVFGFFDTGRRPKDAPGLDATAMIQNRSNYRDVVFTFEPKVKGVSYEGPHYRGENVMGGIRMFDADLPDGQRALFVQEIQSDLHQGARKVGGARTKEMDEALVAHRKASTEAARAPAGPEREAAQARLRQLTDEFEQKFGMPMTVARQRPPEAPFAKTEEWTELGLKRALDEAVAGGYDRIVLANWPQATVASSRRFILDDVAGVRVYPSTKTIEPLRASPRGKVQGVSAVRGGGPVQVERAEDALKFVDDPALAQRMADALNGTEAVTIRFDAPVTFGDRTLKTFYDEKIPSVLKKYLGSMGVKAELRPVTLQVGSAEKGRLKTQPSLALDLTQEIKDKVLAGQRLLGATAVVGGAGAAASAQQEAEDEETKKAGFEFGMNLPTFLALGVGGAAMRSVLTKINAAKAVAATEKAAKVDIQDIARRSAAMVEAQQQATRQAARVARASQRIAQPAGPRPADAWNSPKTPTDVFEFAARIASDPEGLRAVSEATEQALAGGLVRGGRITWETEKAIAKNLGVDPMDLALKDPSRTVSGPEFLALSSAYEAEARRKILLRQVMDDVRYTADERQLASQLYDIVDTRATTIFQRLVRDRGETGRLLNLMKAVKAQSTNPADWLYKAQKLAGGRPLSPEMADELIRAIERGEFVKAKMVLNKAKAANAGALDKAGEFFQTSLLSRLGRPLRDLISNSINSMDRRAQYAIASKLDQALNGFGVYATRSMAGNLGDINRAGKRGARLGWQQALELLRASPTREMTPEALDALERAARRYDFTDESSFTNPFMRAWGTFVRRTIAASDQPFFESAFAMAMETQARARGANAGLKGKALDEFVESTLSNPPSEMVATAISEGAEAVFQNQTTLGKAAASLGGRGAKSPVARFLGKQFIPFAQTPSAIATQAIEQTPLGLLNVAPDAVLAAAGSTAAQRKLVMKLAKVGTGAAWMYTGYLLADEGKMNLFYPDDPNERARWQEENRIANSILVGGKWFALSGLLGPQAMLLTIGGLIRKYMEEDAKGLAASVAQASAVGTAEGFIETPAMTGAQSVMDILKAATQDDPARMEEALGKALESQVTGYIPGIIQQAAAMGDVDEQGRVIMRDPMAGETLSEDIMNALRMGIPGQREQLPAKISPFGRVRSSGPGGLESLVTPFRTTISQATPLTQALEEVGYFPATPTRNKAEGETPEMYRARRMAEGPQEQAFLERLLSGDDAAWQFVSEEAEQDYAETQNAAELVRAALRSYRAARTREQKQPE